MEKEKILIYRIKDDTITEKMDEVALEQQICIPLSSGEQIYAACTPTYIEEMILGRRYVIGDLNSEELKKYNQNNLETEALQTISLEEIFRIARDSFETPGSLFNDTGCAHSCALIYNGDVVCCIEDIGRHNALDKVVGYALLHQIPISKSYIFTSGRISADYLQKVINAGFRLVVSRAAVTANAVALAKQGNVTILGFIRKNIGNIYYEGTVKIFPSAE